MSLGDVRSIKLLPQQKKTISPPGHPPTQIFLESIFIDQATLNGTRPNTDSDTKVLPLYESRTQGGNCHFCSLTKLATPSSVLRVFHLSRRRSTVALSGTFDKSRSKQVPVGAYLQSGRTQEALPVASSHAIGTALKSVAKKEGVPSCFAKSGSGVQHYAIQNYAIDRYKAGRHVAVPKHFFKCAESSRHSGWLRAFAIYPTGRMPP